MSDPLAVSIKDVSKVYKLWQNQNGKLAVTFKRFISFIFQKNFAEEKKNQAYLQFYALNNISFEIKKGESIGFIGLNGSGKSTLLKIISGNLRPSTGKVQVEGKVVILDYNSGFNGEFTGKENIYLKAALMGLSRKKINERINSIIEFAELRDFIDQPVKTYSSGMISRLGFAIVAHVDADIIITDEALAVGDVFFVQKCMKYIQSFLKNGTFLFVSHSVNDVISLCQKAVWLKQGEIQAIGPAREVAIAYIEQNEKSVSNTNDKLQSEAKQLENSETIFILNEPVALDNNNLNDFSPVKKNENYNQLPLFFETNGKEDQGGAHILNVTLHDEAGHTLTQIIGGECAKLSVLIQATSHTLQNPIVIFQVYDRLGQVLFSDHSDYILNR